MRGTTERRQEILEIICERRHDRIANLAFEFQVTRRTIETDIQILSLSYPIYTSRGTGGGVHVIEGYYIGRKYLKPQQETLLKKLSLALRCEDKAILDSIIKTFALNKPKLKE